MYPSIVSSWKKLEHNRLAILAEVEKIDPSVLNTKPNAEGWSINQNILHLIDAENSSIKYIKKKLSFGTDLPKAGFKSQLRLWALRTAFALPLKFKVPTELPKMDDDLSFDELKNRWLAEWADNEVYFNQLPDSIFQAELWRHPVAGKMTLTQMLDFFSIHIDRHREQIERTLAKVRA